MLLRPRFLREPLCLRNEIEGALEKENKPVNEKQKLTALNASPHLHHKVQQADHILLQRVQVIPCIPARGLALFTPGAYWGAPA